VAFNDKTKHQKQICQDILSKWNERENSANLEKTIDSFNEKSFDKYNQ